MNEPNPFKPGSGTPPPYLAGREEQQKLFENALQTIKAGDVHTAIVLYGPRGTGKTTLLDWMEKRCLQQNVFVLQADPGQALTSMETLAAALLPGRGLGSVSGGYKGFSLKWRATLDPISWFTKKLIETCSESPRVLLVDEAHALDRDVCTSLLRLGQNVWRKAPFLMVVAGTPSLVPYINSVNTTFIECSAMLSTDRLNPHDAGQAITMPLKARGITLTEDALAQIIDKAQGYPFFLQQAGKALWEQARERGTNQLTVSDAYTVAPGIKAQKAGFYAQRFEQFSADEPLLRAAEALGKAFEDNGEMSRLAVKRVITESLGGIDDIKTEAERVEQKLYGMDYVWNPANSRTIQPVIPSFMSFVCAEIENERTATMGRQ